MPDQDPIKPGEFPQEFTIAEGLMDPEYATYLLTLNTNNRSFQRMKIKKMAGAMTRGEWRKSASEPFRVSKTGVLLDGQNRCQAVIDSGVTIEVVVYYGCDDEDQLSMGTGTPRSFAHQLEILKVPDAKKTAAATRLLYDMITGELNRKFSWESRQIPTHDQLHRFYLKLDLDRLHSAMTAARRAGKLGFNGSASTVAFYVFAELDEQDCKDFFEKVISGIDLSELHPVLALRRVLSANNPHRPGNNYMHLALIIKAWNAYRDGRDVKVLSFKPGGSSPEAFPTPH